ncbi:MAG: exodeoxyribonuclease VII small subunit [Lachnospiraceae bacterium]|nr:exodeoxyribonuclease VII small subunit [Lachnospiraceae bacterium]
MAEEKQKEKKHSLEENFDMLESNLKKMEDDTLPLEEAFELYQNSMKLLKDCNEEIERVEKKVLLLRDNGETDEFSE